MAIGPQLRFRLWSAVAGAYWCALASLTHYHDAPAITPDFLEETIADKVFHGSAFAVLAILLALAAAAWCEVRNFAASRATRRAALFALVLASLYAVVDEFTQPLTGRRFEIGDLGVDLLGAVCGVLLFRAWRGIGEQ